jgi:hypothetical protein
LIAIGSEQKIGAPSVIQIFIQPRITPIPRMQNYEKIMSALKFEYLRNPRNASRRSLGVGGFAVKNSLSALSAFKDNPE